MGKKQANNQAVAAVVVTTGHSRRKLAIAVAALTILIIAGIVLWLSLAGRSDNSAGADTATRDAQKFQETLADVDELRGSQDYDAAKQAWQGYIDEGAGDEQRYKALLQIGSIDETKGDCKAALVSYREAEKIGTKEWRAENEAIARCSEKLGDLQTALTYYQRTLDTFPGGEEYDSDLRYYKNKIEKLKSAVESGQNG